LGFLQDAEDDLLTVTPLEELGVAIGDVVGSDGTMVAEDVEGQDGEIRLLIPSFSGPLLE